MKQNRPEASQSKRAALLRRPMIRVVAASVLCCASQAQAGWTCSGRVANLTIDPGGTLTMSLIKTDGSPAWTYKQLCNVTSVGNNLQPQVCRSIYAMLTTAVAMGRTVTFWFDYPNSSTPDCSPARFPAWMWLATDGLSPWYYGPQLDGQ